jgi:hypothetical protein
MRNEFIAPREPAFDPGALPVFAPDPALWQRIAAEHRRRVAARRRKLGVVGLAAAAVLALVVGLPLRPPSASAPSVEMTDGQRESQALESEWQRVAATPRQAVGGLARVRVIDAALQSAYDRGAQSDELTTLWRQRNDALRGLIAGVQDRGNGDLAGITRI